MRNQDIEANITIEKSITEAHDLDSNDAFNLHWDGKPSEGQWVCDSALNNFMLKSDSPIFALTSENMVILYKVSIYSPYAVGHFEDTSDNTVLKLVFNQDFDSSKLLPAKYYLMIPVGIIGDANYVNYLNDPLSISLALCHINPEMYIEIPINNSKAIDGIVDISTFTQEKPVYDLIGRRVSGCLTKGEIYISNGKKFKVK